MDYLFCFGFLFRIHDWPTHHIQHNFTGIFNVYTKNIIIRVTTLYQTLCKLNRFYDANIFFYSECTPETYRLCPESNEPDFFYKMY